MINDTVLINLITSWPFELMAFKALNINIMLEKENTYIFISN